MVHRAGADQALLRAGHMDEMEIHLVQVLLGDGRRFPDEPVATLELVHRPGGGRVDVGSGFDHLAIQVDTLATALAMLTEAGLEPELVQYPAGSHGPKTSWLTDPNGYRIELVEWPSGHPHGITAADFS